MRQLVTTKWDVYPIIKKKERTYTEIICELQNKE